MRTRKPSHSLFRPGWLTTGVGPGPLSGRKGKPQEICRPFEKSIQIATKTRFCMSWINPGLHVTGVLGLALTRSSKNNVNRPTKSVLQLQYGGNLRQEFWFTSNTGCNGAALINSSSGASGDETGVSGLLTDHHRFR